MIGKVFIVTESHELSRTLLPTIDLNGFHIMVEELLSDTLTAYVEGYPGLPFLLSNKILTKLEEQTNYNFNKMAKIRTYTAALKLGGATIKTFPSITMSDDEATVRKELAEKIEKYHNLKDGVDYDDVIFTWKEDEKVGSSAEPDIKAEQEVEKEIAEAKEAVSEVPDANPIEEGIQDVEFEETASEEKESPKEVETVEALEETPDGQVKETDFQISFPAIPDKFFIEEKKEVREYSLAVVDKLSKEADDLLKKAVPENYSDDKLFAKIDDLRKRMVKERTNPKNHFDKKLSAPVKAFLKDLQTKVESIGAEAQKVQDKLAEAIKKREDHVAEQARLEDERKTNLALDRATKLQSVGGVYDPVSMSVTVDGVGMFLNEQLREIDDLLFLEKLTEADIIFKKAQEEKTQKDSELEKARKTLEKYRGRDLEDEGFMKEEGGWKHEDGRKVSIWEVWTLEDEAFEAMLSAVPAPVEADKTKQPSAPIEITSYATPKVETDTTEKSKIVILDFIDNPFIEVFFKNSMMRIYQIGNDDIGLSGLDTDLVLAPAEIPELGLKFVPVKLKK